MKYKTLFYYFMVLAGIALIRLQYTGSLGNLYLLWNVFLAIVPLLLLDLFTVINRKLEKTTKSTARFATALAVVLFLPNSFYIITDFMHLNSAVLVNNHSDKVHYGVRYMRGDGLFVLDTLAIFIATVVGAYIGGLVLLRIYDFLHGKVSKVWARAITAGLIFLCSLGVVIGRYGRWNSWDALLYPWRVASDFWATLHTPEGLSRTFLVVTSVSILQVMSLIFAYSSRTKNKQLNKSV